MGIGWPADKRSTALGFHVDTLQTPGGGAPVSTDSIRRLHEVSRCFEERKVIYTDAAKRLLKKHGKPVSLTDDLEKLLFVIMLKYRSTRRHRAAEDGARARAIAWDKSRNPDEAALDYAARLIRLEKLETRNVGRNRALEQTAEMRFKNLSPTEKREAGSALTN